MRVHLAQGPGGGQGGPGRGVRGGQTKGKQESAQPSMAELLKVQTATQKTTRPCTAVCDGQAVWNKEKVQA